MTTEGNLVYEFTIEDSHPRDLAWDGEHLWMIDSLGILKKFTTQGVLVDSMMSLLKGGWGLTYGAEHLWASNPAEGMIYKISQASTIVTDDWPDPLMRGEFSLRQAFPNPFHRQTTIEYQVPRESTVALKIYNLSGELVRILVDDRGQEAGHYSIEWDGRDDTGAEVANGTYFYAIAVGRFRSTKKVALLR